ncbi:MAG: hypothetical protein ACFFD8_01340 [Candidatus Thorarchaeota archaeon]
MASSIDTLFQTNYLPAKLLHRDQELTTLSNLLGKGEEARQPVSVLVHGSFGIGRTTLLRFFAKHELGSYRRPLIRFQYKQPYEIVNDTLQALSNTMGHPKSLPEQWTLIKRLLRKAEVPFVFTFDDVNPQTSIVYGKFLQLCKDNSISSMATAPRYFPRQLSPEISQFVDISLELEPFSDHQFLDIIKQRITEVFPNPVPPQIMSFMADLICVLDFQRPATVMELLQNLVPLLSSTQNITTNTIRQACINSHTLHYDFWSGHLSSLVDLDMTTVLLLQAIGQYFVYNPGQVYVTNSSLFHQYQHIAEGIGLASHPSQFSRALNVLLFQDLLLRSRYSSENFFTLLPAEGYLEIVDLLLGERHLDL